MSAALVTSAAFARSYCSIESTESDIATIAPDVAYIETFLSTVEVGLDNDSANVAHLKGLVKKDAEDAKKLGIHLGDAARGVAQAFAHAPQRAAG